MSVVLIDRFAVGGTSLHLGRGALSGLLHAAHVAEASHGASRLGLGIAFSASNAGAIADHQRHAIDFQHSILQAEVEHAGIEFVQATALIGANYVRIAAGGGEAYLTPRNIVAAVGSVPQRQLGAIGFNGAIVIDPHEAAMLRALPLQPVIIGAGSTGLGFASFWAAMGADVTVVEAGGQPLPAEEAAITSRLALRMEKSGINFRTGTVATALHTEAEHATIELSDGTTAAADLVLLAIGRRPIGDRAGLAALGVLDRLGRVEVDDRYRTRHPGLWAIGSCSARAERARTGIEEGEMVADQLAGLTPPTIEPSMTPRILRTTPDAAFVGMTTSETEQRFGAAARFGFPTHRYPRAAIGSDPGFVTIVTGPNEQITGIHLLGPGAELSVSAAASIVEAKATASEAIDLHAARRQRAPEIHRALTLMCAHSTERANGRP